MVETKDPLVSFIYQLLRDSCPAGEMEKAVNDEIRIWQYQPDSYNYPHGAPSRVQLSNEFIAGYAEVCAKGLRKAWSTRLGFPHFTKRQWEIIEEALEDHEYMLRQSIADNLRTADNDTYNHDVEAWLKEIEDSNEIGKIANTMQHLYNNENGENEP